MYDNEAEVTQKAAENTSKPYVTRPEWTKYTPARRGTYARVCTLGTKFRSHHYPHSYPHTRTRDTQFKNDYYMTEAIDRMDIQPDPRTKKRTQPPYGVQTNTE